MMCRQDVPRAGRPHRYRRFPRNDIGPRPRRFDRFFLSGSSACTRPQFGQMDCIVTPASPIFTLTISSGIWQRGHLSF